ncbi:MAG: hypothetical protein JXR76_14280 [Deltaproteobacteria bacterium]|nr:hypothetical protein [Deltaproteobacteria bacterium]
MNTRVFAAQNLPVLLLLLQLLLSGCTPSPSSKQTPNKHHSVLNPKDTASSTHTPTQQKSKQKLPPDVSQNDVAPPPSPQFEIRREMTSCETFVDISPKGKDRPTINWRSKSKRIFILWNRAQPMSQQTGVLRDMLMELASAEGKAVLAHASMSTSLDWYSNPEVAQRIAQAAATDSDWTDARRTRNQRWDPAWTLNRYIVRVAESKRLFTELDDIFAPLGVRPVLEGVEKCSTARANGKGELGKLLKEGGIRSQKVLPAGCLMSWFELEKL